MVQAIKRNIRCPKCGSSRGLTVYNGDSKDPNPNGSCFSCGSYIKEDDLEDIYANNPVTQLEDNKPAPTFLEGNFQDYPGRNITQAACQRFGVQITDDNRVIFPYFSKEGKFVAQKVRSAGAPKGYWIGDHGPAGFFGMNLWKSSKKITITEGEWDAVAAWQMLGDFPVISVRDGACLTGKKVTDLIKDNYDYFKGFEEIILCFDNDEPGKISAEAAAKMLPAGKVRIMQLTDYKDANDYLRAGAHKQFKDAFWAAPIYTPAGIVAGIDLWDIVSTKTEHDTVAYPYEKLNEMTYGMRLGEMVTIVAGSGVGKSLFIREMSAHLLNNTNRNLGIIMLEESIQKTSLGLMSIHASKPLHLPNTEYTKEELRAAYDATVGLRGEDGSSRVYMYDHFGSTDIESITSTIEYLSRVLGCKYIFLDHISILVSDQSHGDERKALDEIATKLRTSVQENNIALFLVSHLRRPGSKPHEEGGQTSLSDIRGTAGIGQLSDIVLGLERDGQSEDKFERNTTKVRVLKNRFSGLTGITSSLYYDHLSGRLSEIPEATIEDETPIFDKTKSAH